MRTNGQLALKNGFFPSTVFSLCPSGSRYIDFVQEAVAESIHYLEGLTDLRIYSIPVFLVDDYIITRKKTPEVLTYYELRLIQNIFRALSAAFE